MKSLLLSLAASSLLSSIVALPQQNQIWDTSNSASGWYFLRFKIPAGEQFTLLTGEMIVPHLNPITNGGTYYIWPGLEIQSYDGIYQNVLSGRDSGEWEYFSGYCCQNPELPWTNNIATFEGQTISYSNIKYDNTWTTIQGNEATGQTNTLNFDGLVDHEFTSAVFAIELYTVNWDFGPMTFQNIQIKGTGSDASWCNDTPENWNNAADFTITDLTSSVDDTGVTCKIGSIVLNQPAGTKVKQRTVTSTASAPTATKNAGVRNLPAVGGGVSALLLASFCS